MCVHERASLRARDRAYVFEIFLFQDVGGSRRLLGGEDGEYVGAQQGLIQFHVM